MLSTLSHWYKRFKLSRGDPPETRDLNIAITASTYYLAPNVVTPSAGTVLTKMLKMFLWLSQFQITFRWPYAIVQNGRNFASLRVLKLAWMTKPTRTGDDIFISLSNTKSIYMCVLITTRHWMQVLLEDRCFRQCKHLCLLWQKAWLWVVD